MKEDPWRRYAMRVKQLCPDCVLTDAETSTQAFSADGTLSVTKTRQNGKSEGMYKFPV